jgi:UDP-N-acetylmuramoylalanine--D-glutamate ligase
VIELSDFNGSAVAVLGLGRSGLAAAKALSAGGAEVWAWDDDPARRDAAESQDVPIVDLYGCDWSKPAALVISPGIPHLHPTPHRIAEQARRAGREILCDVELLFRARREARYIGVTGTNGKSTTTALLGHILSSAGERVEVGGNLGPPALALAPLAGDGTYVLEMSSFQLELVPTIVFDIAILLNISPDHLDRHGGMDGYIAAKRHVFGGQGPEHTAVIGVDDAHCRAIFAEFETTGAPRTVPISSGQRVEGGVYARDGRLVDEMGLAASDAFDLTRVPSLPGTHNWQNAAAAYAAAKAAGLSPSAIADGLLDYPGLPHRQELVATIHGVQYVNDSKATNAEAAAKALACYDAIYWIAGGEAKEGGLDPLTPHLGRITHAFLVGESMDAFARALDQRVPYSRSGDLATAVAQAHAMAEADSRDGAVVLLSPACASFDQWPSFEARGDAFRDMARALATGADGVGSAAGRTVH